MLASLEPPLLQCILQEAPWRSWWVSDIFELATTREVRSCWRLWTKTSSRLGTARWKCLACLLTSYDPPIWSLDAVELIPYRVCYAMSRLNSLVLGCLFDLLEINAVLELELRLVRRRSESMASLPPLRRCLSANGIDLIIVDLLVPFIRVLDIVLT